MSIIEVGILFCLFGRWITLVVADDECVIPLICNGNPSWLKSPNVEAFSFPKDRSKVRQQCVDLLKEPQDKFNAKVTEMNDRIANLWKEIEKVTATPAITTTSGTATTTTESIENTTSDERSGFQWNGKEFLVTITPSDRINYNEGQEICKKQNSHPANIYNNTHHDQVITYLRPKIPAGINRMELWIGMTYNSSTEVLYQYNNTVTPYQGKWVRSYPNNVIGRIQIAIQVRNGSGNPYEGLRNFEPSFKAFGVLCEIDE